MEPRFEFGFDLSYTEFAYSSTSFVKVDASTSTHPSLKVSVVEGGLPGLWDVLFNISAASANIGDYCCGSRVAVSCGFDGADGQLRGFKEVMPGAGSKR
jgi:beta-glucosidase